MSTGPALAKPLILAMLCVSLSTLSACDQREERLDRAKLLASGVADQITGQTASKSPAQGDGPPPLSAEPLPDLAAPTDTPPEPTPAPPPPADTGELAGEPCSGTNCGPER